MPAIPAGIAMAACWNPDTTPDRPVGRSLDTPLPMPKSRMWRGWLSAVDGPPPPPHSGLKPPFVALGADGALGAEGVPHSGVNGFGGRGAIAYLPWPWK